MRKWAHQVEVDRGFRPGTTSERSAELKRLRREIAELKRANATHKSASTFFEAELDRPTPLIVEFPAPTKAAAQRAARSE